MCPHTHTINLKFFTDRDALTKMFKNVAVMLGVKI